MSSFIAYDKFFAFNNQVIAMCGGTESLLMAL
jgi:hypothetical protein